MSPPDSVTLEPPAEHVTHSLLLALQQLDRLLERVINAVRPVARIADDPFRGLYLDEDAVQQVLAQPPGTSPLSTGTMDQDELDMLPGSQDADSHLHALGRRFALSPFDMEVLLLALAPELDLRYERIFAFLQDDVTRRRPTVDLALNLFCPTAHLKLARRAHFEPEAPLIRHGLVHLVVDPQQGAVSPLGQYLKPDERIASWLLGSERIDARLARYGQIETPDAAAAALVLSNQISTALSSLAHHALLSDHPVRFYFQGPHGAGKRHAAGIVARTAGMRLLVIDLALALVSGADLHQVIGLAFREALLIPAVLYLAGVDALDGDAHLPLRHFLLREVALHPGITILAGQHTWLPHLDPTTSGTLDAIHVEFRPPDSTRRRVFWQAELATTGITVSAENLLMLAGRYQLTQPQIVAAVRSAQNQALLRAAGCAPQLPVASEVTIHDVVTAARHEAARDLTELAHKITPVYTWSDLVLPFDRMKRLRDIWNYIKYQGLVFDEWGFDRKLSLGKGLNILFTGPPGTGKTMAAEILAGDLQIDLYKIDLSLMVSKYIGETEKNLARVFTAAEHSNTILFFDEADALFGARTAVHDAHDRYANIEISYLLQRMEEHDGVVILATNLRKNMDEAFVRRLHFTLDFPLPGQDERRRIWDAVWPSATPRASDLDLDFMARKLEVAGGNIRNIALGAAFLAAAEDGVIGMQHLIRAAHREYEKMGKLIVGTEFGAYAHFLPAS